MNNMDVAHELKEEEDEEPECNEEDIDSTDLDEAQLMSGLEIKEVEPE